MKKPEVKNLVSYSINPLGSTHSLFFVLDCVLGLARLDDLDQLNHIFVLDGVLGLACLDDLYQLIRNYCP
jgi:hypothetical protein